MRADADVVADLDLVVEAHVLFEHGVLKRAAVDRGVRPDLAVVADHHPAELRHLQPLAMVHGDAEAVGAQHRAGMHQHPLAEAHAHHQGDPRDQLAAFADLAVLADHAAWSEHGAGGDAGARAHHHQRADMRAGIHHRGGVDHRRGVDAWRAYWLGFEQRRDPRECGIRVAGEQCGAGAGIQVGLPQYHHAGSGLSELAAIARVGEEAQLPGACRGERAHAVHGAIFAAEFQPEALGQLGRGEGPCGHAAVRAGRRT